MSKQTKKYNRAEVEEITKDFEVRISEELARINAGLPAQRAA